MSLSIIQQLTWHSEHDHLTTVKCWTCSHRYRRQYVVHPTTCVTSHTSRPSDQVVGNETSAHLSGTCVSHARRIAQPNYLAGTKILSATILRLSAKLIGTSHLFNWLQVLPKPTCHPHIEPPSRTTSLGLKLSCDSSNKPTYHTHAESPSRTKLWIDNKSATDYTKTHPTEPNSVGRAHISIWHSEHHTPSYNYRQHTPSYNDFAFMCLYKIVHIIHTQYSQSHIVPTLKFT